MSTVLPPLSLDDVTQSAENPFTTVNTLLSDFNSGHVGPPKHVPLWLLAREPNGKVQGGLLGQTYWSWCSIDVLAVAESYRRQGIGSRLLAKAEHLLAKDGHWRAVELIAAELLRYGAISGRAARHLFDQACAPC